MKYLNLAIAINMFAAALSLFINIYVDRISINLICFVFSMCLVTFLFAIKYGLSQKC